MIIIMGCSWGVGEWGTNNELTGPGIGQYFSLHGKVINLSEGGSSNTRQLNYLKDLLCKFTPGVDDTFYWIITDPVRCYIDSDTLDQILSDHTSIKTVIESKLDTVLKEINQVAIDHNIHINLIGGLCDLDTVDVSNYKKLTITVPSWGKLLDSAYSSSLYCDDYMEELGTIIRPFGSQVVDEWQQVSDQALQKRASMYRLFDNKLSNDKYHPNRHAHKILRDFLAPEFHNKF